MVFFSLQTSTSIFCKIRSGVTRSRHRCGHWTIRNSYTPRSESLATTYIWCGWNKSDIFPFYYCSLDPVSKLLLMSILIWYYSNVSANFFRSTSALPNFVDATSNISITFISGLNWEIVCTEVTWIFLNSIVSFDKLKYNISTNFYNIRIKNRHVSDTL